MFLRGWGAGLVQFLQGKLKISPVGIAHLTPTLKITLCRGVGGCNSYRGNSEFPLEELHLLALTLLINPWTPGRLLGGTARETGGARAEAAAAAQTRGLRLMWFPASGVYSYGFGGPQVSSAAPFPPRGHQPKQPGALDEFGVWFWLGWG